MEKGCCGDLPRSHWDRGGSLSVRKGCGGRCGGAPGSSVLERGDFTWCDTFHRFGDGRDVVGCISAAATSEIE